MIGLLVFLTYVLQLAGAIGVLAGLALLVASGPRREQSTTTYWLGDQQINRAEYLNLRRSRRG